MNYFEQSDFDVFQNGGKPRDTLLEKKYHTPLDKFKELTNKVKDAVNKKLPKGDELSVEVDVKCLTTPGRNVNQTLISYKWARFYIHNCQGLLKPNTNDPYTQNVFGLSINKDGLHIGVNINLQQTKTISKEQKTAINQIENRTRKDISNDDLNRLVDTISEYILSHESDYLENGAILGIQECIRRKTINTMKQLLITNYNLILTGAPGTGKTYLAMEIAKKITGDSNDNNHPHYEMVQFHPSYDYSDFVEGLRPISDSKGNIGFIRMDGVFKAFCKKALNVYNNSEEKEDVQKFVFIIDEINRGEMSKIFGELFFSIDHGYRGVKGKIKTQYQNLVDKEYDANGNMTTNEDLFKDGFFIPENVYIIGTMNDIDRSVESMDFAMRRRFAFKEIRATDRESMLDEKIKDSKVRDKAILKMHNLNYRIQTIDGLNEAYHVGPSYFGKIKKDDDFGGLWDYHIKGLLYEYLRGMPNAKELLESLYRAYEAEESYVIVNNGDLVLDSNKSDAWKNKVIEKK